MIRYEIRPVSTTANIDNKPLAPANKPCADCDALRNEIKRLKLELAKAVSAPVVLDAPKKDRKTYMRDLMRARRAKAKT